MKLGKLYPLQVNELVEKRTVLNHFNYIRNTVKLSNVMPYGDFSIGQNKLYSYIGKSPEVFSKYLQYSNSALSFNKRNVSLLTYCICIIILNNKYYLPKCIIYFTFNRIHLSQAFNFQKIHINHIR